MVSTPLKNMLVKLDHFPKVRGENKKSVKPPPSQGLLLGIFLESTFFFAGPLGHEILMIFCQIVSDSNQIQRLESDPREVLIFLDKKSAEPNRRLHLQRVAHLVFRWRFCCPGFSHVVKGQSSKVNKGPGVNC